MKAIKFATQIDKDVLRDLKEYTKLSDRTISSVVTEALSDYLKKGQLRPAFRSVMQDVLDENSELLNRLAK